MCKHIYVYIHDIQVIKKAQKKPDRRRGLQTKYPAAKLERAPPSCFFFYKKNLMNKCITYQYVLMYIQHNTYTQYNT